MFVQTYKAFCFKRTSQAMIATLLSTDQSYFKGMTKNEIDTVMKGVQAFGQLLSPLAVFAMSPWSPSKCTGKKF